MIKVDQVKINISASENELKKAAAKKLKINESEILDLKILKKSIDARKKPEVFYVFSLAVTLDKSVEQKIFNRFKKDGNINPYKEIKYSIPKIKLSKKARPIIIGAGPAGLFCAYLLALNNLNPIILERGRKIEERSDDVLNFWKTGILDASSNVQFGEGGAGTFSDGKLNTLVNDKLGRNKFVLETFVKFGADSRILYDYKPHIGTDVLRDVIANLRNEIIRLGGEFFFNTTVNDFIIKDGCICGVNAGDKVFESDCVVIAIGHSARDTFEKLNESKINMISKDFAVGFRIEHPQEMISRAMYSEVFSRLEPANYKLACNLDNGRGVYSFCMCPGGYVVNSSSEENRLVVNGMSYAKRDSANANSAIVVTVGENEFDKLTPLSGMYYQRHIEERAYSLCSGKIPQQLFSDFAENKLSTSYGAFESVSKGSCGFGMLSDIFSHEISKSVIDGIRLFGTKIKGFDRDDAILSGIESRTSSPVRILRDENFMSNIRGLYPCGEGAGYAGGITSAAMDGMKVAEAIAAAANF